MRVLVAEDDLTIRTWLKIKLQGWGYDVDLAEDGLKAFESFKTHRQGLVIVDWIMPRMDGIALIHKIRERSNVGQTYIILISAKQEGDDLLTGVEAGADDYIIKPVEGDELHARIIAANRILDLEKELQRRNDSLEYANTQMKQDMSVAARIQQSFLPHLMPEFEKVSFEWGLLSCDELAGDALNVIPLDESQVGFFLLDVSGHGVAAALLAMTLIHSLSSDRPNSLLFRSTRKEDHEYEVRRPSEVAARLNQQFPMDDIIGQYFTFIYGILNLDTLVVTYTSAGHPGPVVTPAAGKVVSHPSTGMPIGFMPDATFEDLEIQLFPGDRLYVFSDGIAESTNKYEEQFGNDRLMRILRQNQTAMNLRGSIDNLAVSALKWNGLSPMVDDMSIVGLEIKKDEAE